MDGGSIERWEDDNYRSVFESIINGRWEEFNPWELGEYSSQSSKPSSPLMESVDKRAVGRQDLYPGPGSVRLCVHLVG
jgi:type 1 glutamine amidotransferase